MNNVEYLQNRKLDIRKLDVGYNATTISSLTHCIFFNAIANAFI
jgi:hypothetical protein